MTLYIAGAPAHVTVIQNSNLTDTLILTDGSGEVDRCTVPTKFVQSTGIFVRTNHAVAAWELVQKNYGANYTVTWLGRGFEVNLCV